MSAHLCHAIGCPVDVEPRMLMCRPHWRMVPRALRGDVWSNYRRGQEVDKNPTPRYLDAADAAVKAVALKELKRGRRAHDPQGELFHEQA